MQCFAALVLALVVVLQGSHAQKPPTWAEVKKCGTDLIFNCHKNCSVNATLDKTFADQLEACERTLTTAVLGSGEKCLLRRGFPVNDNDPCWDVANNGSSTTRVRRQTADQIRKLQARLPGLMKYAMCLSDCAVPAKFEGLSCMKSCSAAAQQQRDAVKFCQNDKSTQTEVTRAATNAASCFQRAFYSK